MKKNLYLEKNETGISIICDDPDLFETLAEIFKPEDEDDYEDEINY